ncbi:winged helix-turn-helix transcriptional regulator [Plantactinospora sp. S1510]|uniref:Winged helix-turn-helix transcriptional regulator n=1 Tax=Plantactinospora alkalitolerans TaxID=2789879 RepID=A0ABS0GNH6_9ACTN|nr:winged helix-turn-helix domain-containing protein [Plantactinospora alkalitolerans]MBF9127651.1 winged helix-turn-helix transcriptional regulator [Plantactinospora alkalitolerans]
MAVLLVDAEVMAQARFGTSQLTEMLGALNILRRGQPLPWHRAWRDQHVDAFHGYLDGDPVTAAIVAHAISSFWMADFLTVPPARPDMTLDDELLVLESLPDERIREDLALVRSPLAPDLRSTGLASRTAALLRWVWHHTIEADWPRRQSVLRADVVSRISRLGRDGWSGVFNDMRPGMRWLGDGRLQVEERPYPPYDVRGGELRFFAAHCRGGWVSWRLPDRFGIVYPVTGIFAEMYLDTPAPLRRLLGNARSVILLQAAEPVSTTAVVAATGLPLGTVGGHLRVLTEAGLLQKRRSGREVLYWWTDTAQALVAGASTRPRNLGTT